MILLYDTNINMKEGFSFSEILFFIVGIFAVIAIAGTVIFISSTNIEDADYDATQNIQDVEKSNKALKGSLSLNISEPSTQGASDSFGEAEPGIYCADKSRNSVELGLLSGASEEQREWYLENCK